MADNTVLDPGAGGDTVATDDVAGVHYQRVKLTDGTADSTAAIPGDATNGLDVDVTRVQGTVTVDSELTTADLDTGAGTDTRAVVGIVGAASGGGALIDGTAANGLEVDVTRVQGTVTVSGTVTANAGSGTLAVDTELPAAAALADNTANPTVPAVGSFDHVWDGANWDRAPGDTANGLDVDVTRLPAGTVAGAASLPAGTNNIGDVDVLTIAAGTNAIGDVGIIPRTSGGLSKFRSLDLDETEEEVKGSAGQLFGWYLYNDGATEAYVKIYNATAANVTVGTTTPDLTIPVPAGAAANVVSPIGIAFSTAITAAATTGVADADTGAPAANQVIANIFYA